MHHHEDTGEIQHGGQDRTYGNIAVVHDNVRHGDVLHHQEGGSAHNRRHNLPAGGGRGLDRAGKLGLVAGLLHHRNGDGAGGHGVADRGTGHHAAQGGGDDRDLRRTAGGSARDGVCKLDKELGNARLVQECAEDDEQDNEVQAGTDGGADNAVSSVEEVIYVHAQGLLRHGVDDKHGSHDYDRESDSAAAGFQGDQNADHAQPDLDGLEHNAAVDNLAVIKHEVTVGHEGQRHQDNIIPGNEVDLLGQMTRGRKVDEHQQDDQAHEGSALHTNLAGIEQKENRVQREQDKEHAHDAARNTLVDADVGLAVIFFENRGGILFDFLRRRAEVVLFNQLFIMDLM